jgi:general secretion pathway protein G
VKDKAFTLIEIMMVLVIIGILVSLMSAATFQAMKSSKESKAQADIAALETALSAYKGDYGDYPPNLEGYNNFKVFLEEEHSDCCWNGPYMHFKDEDLDGDDLLDPWGKAYRYNVAGANNGDDYFDLWSCGPDGVDESGWNDDLNNWE